MRMTYEEGENNKVKLQRSYYSDGRWSSGYGNDSKIQDWVKLDLDEIPTPVTMPYARREEQEVK